MISKSKSIFTPIDDNRSMLAGAWGFGEVKADTPIKQELPKGPADSNGTRSSALGQEGGRPLPPAYPQPQRTASTASLGEKRPNLKLQIPSEPESDTGGATGSAMDSTAVLSPKPAHGEGSGGSGDRGSSDRPGGGAAAGPGGAGGGSEMPKAGGVHLPPPSPSASALLSAGAQGPPNPFARPLPPNAGAPGQPGTSAGPGGSNTAAYSSSANIETPMSALPSRVLGDQFLPSPSSFYPEWGFGSGNGGRSAGGMGESNMLPSPLNWQTPVAGQGPEFGNEKDEEGRKREREGGEEGDAKRVRA
jgi:MADS-box transcription factor